MSNGRWAAMIEVPRGPDGRRRRQKRQARTKAEAQRLLAKMRHELATNGQVSDARRTIAQAVETYDDVLNLKRRAKSTANSHRWMLDLVATGLGGRRVSELTVTECDEFLQRCGTGLRPDSRPIGNEHLRRVRAMLIAVLRNEHRIGTVHRNVAELSNMPDVPKRRHQDRRALERAELRQLLARAEGAVEVFIDLTGRNALRPAEARAACWKDDIDLDRGVLHVKFQMDEDDDPTDTKTVASTRTIRLDSRSIGRLTAWRDLQQRYRQAAGPNWHDQGLIVTTRRGTAINRNNIARSLETLCKKLGIEPIVPYELRHTAISHQADLGHSSWEIADWSGSSERMISEVYRHRLAETSKLTPADELPDLSGLSAPVSDDLATAKAHARDYLAAVADLVAARQVPAITEASDRLKGLLDAIERFELTVPS